MPWQVLSNAANLRTMSLLTRLIPSHLKQSLKRALKVPSLELRLENIRNAGFFPKQVIDVGAFRTDWAMTCKQIFPSTALLMIEGQEDMEPMLKDFCEKHPDCSYLITLVGEQNQSVFFTKQASNSRIVGKEEFQYLDTDPEERQCQTLESILQDSPFETTEFLKLDVQGKELEVLRGAGALLQNVEVIQMEISIIRIGPVPIFIEVINQMSEWGFRLYDILGPNYRPRDKALWQVDALFVREGSQLIASDSWN